MAQMMLVNPRKRRRKTAKKKTVAKRRPRRVTTLARARKRAPARRRRSNPIKFNVNTIMKNTVMPSATAAGGALAVDLLLGYIPLPAMLKTGPARHLVKGVAAIGMGILAANFVRPRTAELFATGAMTVAMYGAGKEMIGKFAPNIQLGGEFDEFDLDSLGYMSPGMVVDEGSMGYYEDENMGAWDNDLDL
jgi:hypothetical protein